MGWDNLKNLKNLTGSREISSRYRSDTVPRWNEWGRYDGEQPRFRECTYSFEMIAPSMNRRAMMFGSSLKCCGELVAKHRHRNVTSPATAWGYHSPVMMQVEVEIIPKMLQHITMVELARYVSGCKLPCRKARYRRFYGFQIHTAAGREYREVARDRRYEASSDDDDRYDEY